MVQVILTEEQVRLMREAGYEYQSIFGVQDGHFNRVAIFAGSFGCSGSHRATGAF